MLKHTGGIFIAFLQLPYTALLFWIHVGVYGAAEDFTEVYRVLQCPDHPVKTKRLSLKGGFRNIQLYI